MPTREEALAELYTRGKLTENQKSAFEELVRRGSIKPPAFTMEPADDSGALPGVGAGVVQYNPTGNELPAAPEETLTFRQEAMKEIAEEMGPLDAFLAGTGKGFVDIPRGLGIMDPPEAAETEAMGALKEERPYTTGAGEIVGQAAPFVIPGAAAGKIASLPLRMLASGAVGGAEGGILSKAGGQDVGTGVGLGAGIGMGAEVLFPVLGRLGRKIFQRVTGRVPKGAMLDAAGNPTQELKEALGAAGMSFDDLTEDAVEVITKQKPGADPEQVARKALFDEEGIPISRGDLRQGTPEGYKQQATEQRLLESSTDVAAAPFRAFKLKQSEAIKENLRKGFGLDATKEETGQLSHDVLMGRNKLLRTQKNELYKASAENAEDLGDVMIFNDGIKEAVPEKATMRRLSRIKGSQVGALEDLLVEFGVNDNPVAIEKFMKSGGEVMPLSLKNFEEFNQALKSIMRADQSGATQVAGNPIRDALSNEIDDLVETLTNRAGWKEHKGKLIDVDRLRSELDNNSKIIGFIKKRVKAESIAPDTEAMAKALKERGVPIMQQINEGETAFANRIKGDYTRIFKTDPILKNIPGEVMADPELPKLITRNAEIKQILDESSSKIPNEIIDRVLEPLKEARKTVRTLKTEFSPQSFIGKVTGTKKGGADQIIEASKIYDKLIGRAAPVEDARKFMKSLLRSGEKGKQAVASLQATTLMDLIDAGFGTESRKISGIMIFNPIAFKRRIKAIGPDKLKALFSNEKQTLKKLNNIEKIATDLIPPSGAVPKGSATVLLDVANSLGLVAISHKLPGGAWLMSALKALSAPIERGAAVKKAMKAVPEVANMRLMIEQTFPGIASALGIAAATTEEK